MKKKLLYFLIASICISLTGIIFVQFLWIRNAFQIKEAQFNRSVNEALGSAVNSLETRENMFFISRNFEGDSILSIVQAFTRDTNRILKGKLDSLLALNECYFPSGRPPPLRHPSNVRTLPGVFHYSYRVQMSPDAQFPDSVMMNLEEFYNTTPAFGSMEFNFSWDDQQRQMDSIFEINQKLFEISANGEPFPEELNIQAPKQKIQVKETYERLSLIHI